MGNKKVVLDALRSADEPLKTGEIAKLCGLDKKEVDKAMKDLKKEKVIVSPKRCYWEVK
ncbi:MAG: MarR family transcriptional regulator [Candidatus Cloacimonetes bacterium]|jgi:chromosome segregation and condensation protein ScpB|nr:MarR family transcriptional regulator [Candidatus Cloacimonadota bacterium]MBT6994178.1 MarR family transcriptional regulator [Candidatus Cloacimonadota bacterium]MBT7469733.1 MarR family transcriptional regulator [Candidatus Cloacimonadota bacterium]